MRPDLTFDSIRELAVKGRTKFKVSRNKMITYQGFFLRGLLLTYEHMPNKFPWSNAQVIKHWEEPHIQKWQMIEP